MEQHNPTSDRLRELGRNLWWSWQPDVIEVFRDFSPEKWRDVNHNPVAFLDFLTPGVIEVQAAELAMEHRISYSFHRLREYEGSTQTWGHGAAGCLRARPVAYFSAEFGLHESLPIYSGGLGVLAGDHVKSASDLGVPLVAVGLLYAQGYFIQKLDQNHWQTETYFDLPLEKLPVTKVKDKIGRSLLVHLDTADGRILAEIWTATVGRNLLVLLNTDVEGNTPEDKELTARLYGGDQRIRIRQELVLGVGGIRALRALGIRPGVLHLNEGHSAFATLEMARQKMERESLSFVEAAREVKQMTVFTTHTPVEAGHDRFSPGLVENTLKPLREALKLDQNGLMAMGRVHPEDGGELFCMTVLGLKLSLRANGVSALHGRTARQMWQCLWPTRLEQDVPIGHITNGVHVPSWLSPGMREFYQRYLGRDWEQRVCDPETWAGLVHLDDSELWEAHQLQKTRLIHYIRRQLRRQHLSRYGALLPHVNYASIFDPQVLTIGFARRFATYKRADLILNNVEKLARMVNDADRPIQIVFAGKAHPADHGGKLLIQKIVHICQDPRFRKRMVFLENQDINVGRHMVQGVDVWLNNPRRPLEASGTSGQKALLNGALNLSVLDGWWAEAYDGRNGFAIGEGLAHKDPAKQDEMDAENLFRALEEEVIPLYYDRDPRGIPAKWAARMKWALVSLAPRFNANRMVLDYVREMYLPASGGLSCEMGCTALNGGS